MEVLSIAERFASALEEVLCKSDHNRAIQRTFSASDDPGVGSVAVKHGDQLRVKVQPPRSANRIAGPPAVRRSETVDSRTWPV